MIKTMNSSPQLGLHPLNDCILVELKQSHKNFTTKEGKYDTRTEGIVIAVPDVNGVEDTAETIRQVKLAHRLINKRIHFEEFQEGSRIKRDGKIYSFIKISEIRGYEDEQTN